MKTIGMLGGMSWESSLAYYRIVNETVKARLGGLHSAKCLMFSLDFEEVEQLQQSGDWEAAGRMLAEAAVQLERGGADFILICTNTMHKVAGAVEAAVQVPLLHIVDPTAAKVCDLGLKRIGLLGTAFTMEEAFYKGRLADKYGLEVLIPDGAGRKSVHDIIYQELCLGVIESPSRARYRQIMADLVARGAEGIILGCTEIGLLVDQSDSPVPLFDTTQLHAEAAVDMALRP